MFKDIKRNIKKKLVRERIVPVIIKDIQTNLLRGKTALISGGSSGIGYAIAKKIAESGGKVIILGSNENKLKQAAKQIEADYLVANIKDIDNLKVKIENLTPKTSIDILVNSAGTHGSGQFGSVTEEDWNSVMDVNLKGCYFLSQYISQYMIKNHIKGHILNISSASSIKPGWTPYEISKRAVNGITLGFAHKLAPYGIIVNGLAPGPTGTPMLNFHNDETIDLTWSGNPTGRVSTVEEIANLAIFMISDLGNGIVGDTFFMTGGSGTVCTDK